MTDLHLRILRMVARQRQRELDDHDVVDQAAAPRPPGGGAISKRRPGGPKRTSRRPKRDGATHGLAPPCEPSARSG